MGTPSHQHLQTRLSNNRASNFNWRARMSYIWDGLEGFDFSTSARFSVKATDALELSLEPEYERERTPRQYFTQFEGTGRAETFGNRYVFSTIDRSTLCAEIRMNYAVTPDLSLELYAEPFAASGRRYAFGELLKPRSKDLRFYGTDGTTITETADGLTVTDGTADPFDLENLHFNDRSFRSNFVLRYSK